MPWVTTIIAGINVYVFCTGHGWGFRLEDLLQHPVDLVRYQFTHIDAHHLFGNLLFLILVGPSCERALGHLKYSIVYVFCGCVAAIGFLSIFPDATIVGASGAIAGLLAIYPFTQRTLVRFVLSGLVMVVYFYINLQGFVAQIQGIPLDQAYLAHLFGGLTGLICICTRATTS